MNCKLVAGLACGMILLLGACSGNPPPPGTSTTPTPPPTDGEDMTGVENAQLTAANKAIEDARAKVKEAEDALALTAVDASNTVASRKDARDKIKAAIDELAAAETEVRRLLAVATEMEEDAEIRSALLQRQVDIVNLRATKTEELRTAEKPLFWFTGALARQTLARDEVQIPREDVNDADISRTPRRIPTSSTVPTPKDNPDRIKADTFEDIPYASGKMVFSTDKENEKAAHDGTETFKVNGYTNWLSSNEALDDTSYTGLQLNGDGLVIRFGGNGGTAYPDTIMKLGTAVDNGVGTNKWDLRIKFDAPQTVDVDKGVASWTGNGDFYWKAIADADDSQLQTTGANYAEGQLPQPAGHKDLGVYEVWLSNHIRVNQNLEPKSSTTVVTCPDQSLSSANGGACPSDDTHDYLKYAAYGLFLYTADDGLLFGGYDNEDLRAGRVQSINFGYSAFQDATGKKTSNIKTAITEGTFTGETIALAYTGDAGATAVWPFPRTATKLARGNVSLTVNIPKSSVAADINIKGTISDFEEWDALNNRWKTGLSLTSRAATAATGTVTTVYLNVNGSATGAAVPITEGTGAFSGVAKAAGTNIAAVLNDHGSGDTGGVFKGNFYGPRENPDELEVAGSWRIGYDASPELSDRKWAITGSFGAKQSSN